LDNWTKILFARGNFVYVFGVPMITIYMLFESLSGDETLDLVTSLEDARGGRFQVFQSCIGM